MNKFQVIQPSVLLTPYVKQYWFVTMENVVRGSQRLIPFGCTALIFYRGRKTYSLIEGEHTLQSVLYGITTEYTNIVYSGNIDFIAVVFQAIGAKAFFNVPINELNNGYLPLDILGDKQLYSIEQQLNETTNSMECLVLIEQFLFQRIYQIDKYEDERLSTVVNSIRIGETDVNRMADNACLGYKQFKRVFTEGIGINPKKYLQIQRFQKLHHLLQQHTKMTLSQLAYECGYYDKSHLIKELKDFTGFSPTELQKACDPIYSDYHALFRSAFVDLPFD